MRTGKMYVCVSFLIVFCFCIGDCAWCCCLFFCFVLVISKKRMNRRFILFSGLVLVLGWVKELQNWRARNKLIVLQMWTNSSILVLGIAIYCNVQFFAILLLPPLPFAINHVSTILVTIAIIFTHA